MVLPDQGASITITFNFLRNIFALENLNIVGAVGEKLLAFALVTWPT